MRVRLSGGESVAKRAERLARETVEAARKVAPDAPPDDEVAELFYIAGYEQCLRDIVRDADTPRAGQP